MLICIFIYLIYGTSTLRKKFKYVQNFQLIYSFVEYKNVLQVMNVYIKIGMVNNKYGKRLHWQEILIFWLVHSLSD